MKKEMLINVLQPEECRIAILEEGILEELYVERTSLENYTGNIYKGKIVNIEPAIQAAFVDFSVGRNGFLHVSDVEPQYYRRLLGEDVELGGRDRGRDPRRVEREEPRPRRGGEREETRPARGPEREDYRPPRGEERPARPSAPPPPYEETRSFWGEEPPAREPGPGRPPHEERSRDREGPGPGEDRGYPERSRDWDRDRDRPDRSEKGRRDRTRRFGEGLSEDWLESEAASRPSREPQPPQELPPAEPPSPRWGSRRSEPERTAFGSERPSREREDRPADPIESELPPSRTQRPRSASPPPPRFGGDLLQDVPPEPAAGPFGDEPAAPPDPRRGRGRGRPSRPPREPRPVEDLVEPEPELDDVPPREPEEFPGREPEPPAGAPPRRRGGRAAIRARGTGEREPERPRESSPQHPRGLAAERPYEPPDSIDWNQPALEPPPERLPEPEPPREPERGRPYGRAGEPGYIPRRERLRGEPEPNVGPPAGRPEAGWGGFWEEPAADDDLADREDDEESEELLDAGAGDKEEARRGGRRRRRRRRRDRGDRPDEPGAADEDSPELLDELPAPRRPQSARLPADDFDHGAEDLDEFVEDEDEAGGLVHEGHPVRSPDEEIDPELEEEIRREIEEIAELEREMGLRGPVEARPRRGADREASSADPRVARGPRARTGAIKPPIQEIFKRGDEVLVQVIKESIGTKGPTLSTYISIPGRYLVLMPGLNRVGVSRKIADEGQRRKLREIMQELNPPKGLGFIVRTAGLDRSKRELARDLAYLLRLWKVILRRIRKTKAPAPIYQESDMIIRTIRDVFSADIDTIWIDERNAYERALEFMRVVMPKHVDRIRFYDEKVPLFHKYGIEEEIAKIQRRRVDLPEGGSIVIDQTEALVAIDVNSGNFRVEDDAEKTAYEMNLRAAKEIARQLRLRDLGGVIVNDFIDMREEKHRRGVERALRDAIRRDRARSKILRMSQFGLIEMTRQRIRPSLKRSVYEDCTHCKGAGVVKTVESMAIDVMRLLALAAHRPDVRRIDVCVSAQVATHLNNRKRQEVARVEAEGNLSVLIRHLDAVPAEHLQIECYDGHGSEIRFLPPPTPPHPKRSR